MSEQERDRGLARDLGPEDVEAHRSLEADRVLDPDERKETENDDADVEAHRALGRELGREL